jgi:hypothetical protein
MLVDLILSLGYSFIKTKNKKNHCLLLLLLKIAYTFGQYLILKVQKIFTIGFSDALENLPLENH